MRLRKVYSGIRKNPRIVLKLFNTLTLKEVRIVYYLDSLNIKFIMTKESTKLIEKIAEEHYNITNKTDGNLNYLWYMYHAGVKKGEFKPFIYMAELMLLKKYDYVNDSEIQNILTMMKSDDADNFNMVTLSLDTLRNLRVNNHGVYNIENIKYKGIEEIYGTEILNHLVFRETLINK